MTTTELPAPYPISDPPPVRRPALSPSRAVDFKQCPLKYRFRAVDRIPETPSRAAVRGTVVHAALEDLYGLAAVERVLDRAAGLVEPAWERMVEAEPVLAELVTGDDRAEFFSEAKELIERYYLLEDPTRFEPEAREQRVEVELADGAVLRGYVDRIDLAPTGEVRVVDYKTGRAPGEMRESRALFQMKFYALVILRTRGIVPKQLRLLYLADAEILTYEPDEGELLRFERTLSALWTAILTAGETGDFQPNPGPHCQWCDYKPLCPAFDGTPPPYPGWPTDFVDEHVPLTLKVV
ncbi:RecB family exonuclease [Antrihabitans stalactiti]|uniref:RecB family exonuclease n=1 Tax=Antrihabitans stalactiti TaxID=2584121 RepID=UPI0030B856CE